MYFLLPPKIRRHLCFLDRSLKTGGLGFYLFQEMVEYNQNDLI